MNKDKDLFGLLKEIHAAEKLLDNWDDFFNLDDKIKNEKNRKMGIKIDILEILIELEGIKDKNELKKRLKISSDEEFQKLLICYKQRKKLEKNKYKEIESLIFKPSEPKKLQKEVKTKIQEFLRI